jgi:hypothetical protein
MKTVFQLTHYISPVNETSFYKGIPIQYLELTRKILKSNGFTCKIRYRGPRNKGIDTRWFNLRQSTCLKQNATSFTVYEK